MLNLSSVNVCADPYPHAVVDGIFDADFFRALSNSYPTLSRSDVWNRMTADLMIGDPAYAQLVSSGPWRRLHEYFSSQAFVDCICSLLAPHVRDGELLIDIEDCRLGSHVETREWLATTKVPSAIAEYRGERSEVFVRVDLGVGEVGYMRGSHLDWRHRICSLLIYFDDAEDLSMEGGAFNVERLHRGRAEVVRKVLPRQNMAILKLDNNHSFHSVDAIRRIRSCRRTLYVAVSSRGNIWREVMEGG